MAMHAARQLLLKRQTRRSWWRTEEEKQHKPQKVQAEAAHRQRAFDEQADRPGVAAVQEEKEHRVRMERVAKDWVMAETEQGEKAMEEMRANRERDAAASESSQAKGRGMLRSLRRP